MTFLGGFSLKAGRVVHSHEKKIRVSDAEQWCDGQLIIHHDCCYCYFLYKNTQVDARREMITLKVL